MEQMRESIRLLLVDDEEEFLDSAAKALSRRGFEVLKAPNGSFALEVLQKEPIHVAVLDVKMPGIDGEDLFREVRRRWPEVKVIMLTGHGTVQQAFRTSKAGVVEYLSKPCEMDKLAEVIRRILALPPASVKEINQGCREIRLLVVDDEEELVESLVRSLSRRGMIVAGAVDGTDALEKLDHQTFDVVLLDVKMPGVNGIDLLQWIKQARPQTEVILYTGHPTTAMAVEGLKEGAYDFMIKPQNVDALVRKIQEAFLSGSTKAEEERKLKLHKLLEGKTD